MKAKIFLCIIGLSFNFSCEEDNKCNKNSFLGSWMGTKKCDNIELLQANVSIELDPTTNNLIINESTIGQMEVNQMYCDFNGTTSNEIQIFTLNGNFAEGVLTMDFEVKMQLGTMICKYKITRS